MRRFGTAILAAAFLATMAVCALRPAPVRAEAAGAVPSDLLGEWWWTSITGVTYSDVYTGAQSAPSGMATRFTFLKGGKYKFFFYVRMQTYNLVTWSTTTEEGTVRFNSDGTFQTKPTKGHYKGSTAGKPLDRPMTAAERKPKTYNWEWRTENGKKVLYIGPSKTSMSLFKRP